MADRLDKEMIDINITSYITRWIPGFGRIFHINLIGNVETLGAVWIIKLSPPINLVNGDRTETKLDLIAGLDSVGDNRESRNVYKDIKYYNKVDSIEYVKAVLVDGDASFTYYSIGETTLEEMERVITG